MIFYLVTLEIWHLTALPRTNTSSDELAAQTQTVRPEVRELECNNRNAQKVVVTNTPSTLTLRITGLSQCCPTARFFHSTSEVYRARLPTMTILSMSYC